MLYCHWLILPYASLLFRTKKVFDVHVFFNYYCFLLLKSDHVASVWPYMDLYELRKTEADGIIVSQWMV